MTDKEEALRPVHIGEGYNPSMLISITWKWARVGITKYLPVLHTLLGSVPGR